MKSASELGEFVENFSPCNLHLEDPSAAPQDDKVRGGWGYDSGWRVWKENIDHLAVVYIN